jgi:hypothetical protein
MHQEEHTMTCLEHSIKPSALQLKAYPGPRGSHQQAALLALHFRSASWTPCAAAPTLLAAAILVDAVDSPQAGWDVWYFRGASAHHMAAPGLGGRGSLRRARLRAGASLVADDGDASWIAVLEERVPLTSKTRARRLVARLRIDPYAVEANTAAVDPRAVVAVDVMPARETSAANPQPDVSVDLEALGLIAPRSGSW